ALPYGRVALPYGRVALPYGRVALPYGRVALPYGRVALREESVALREESVALPSGRVALPYGSLLRRAVVGRRGTERRAEWLPHARLPARHKMKLAGVERIEPEAVAVEELAEQPTFVRPRIAVPQPTSEIQEPRLRLRLHVGDQACKLLHHAGSASRH